MGHDDKQLEAFIDKVMSNDTLETPSLDFTDNLMSEINAPSNATVTVYSPLIPKSVWVFVFVAFGSLVAYVYLNEPATSSKWLEAIDLSLISNPFENASINFSKTMVYTIVLFAVMLLIQVPLLKHYFNKRMAV